MIPLSCSHDSGSPHGLLILLALGLTGSPPALAQTYVAGPVAGTWTPAGNPYVATDTLRVVEGESLTIEPGVEVHFAGAFPLLVEGLLHAAGAEGDSIYFAPTDPGSPWSGIRFLAADNGSLLEYCCISGTSVVGLAANEGGAGVSCVDSSPLIAHCRIENCRLVYEGSGWELCGGGGISCVGGSPRILDNRIRSCLADVVCTSGGGGIWCLNSDAIIQSNMISDCSAHGLGGGIGAEGSQVDISHNVIFGCSGFHYGGGISLRYGCTGMVFNNLIFDNTAEDTGGGGLFLREADVEISSCTLTGNTAVAQDMAEGGGLCVWGAVQPWIHDCIFWDNSAPTGPQIAPANLYFVDHCNIQGGYGSGSNIDMDPLFVAGGIGDLSEAFYLSAVVAGQAADSPCIDAGSVPASAMGLDQRTTRTDLEPDSGTVDMGYHYRIDAITQVENTPAAIRLAQNRPNPFNPCTTISFEVHAPTDVTLAIFDLTGSHILTLFAGEVSAGVHEVPWLGRDRTGRAVASGIYFYRLQAAGRVLTKGMTLLR